jgi:hypothetical protein
MSGQLYGLAFCDLVNEIAVYVRESQGGLLVLTRSGINRNRGALMLLRCFELSTVLIVALASTMYEVCVGRLVNRYSSSRRLLPTTELHK